jgi:Tfp pilus assembly ATPase PilU
VAAVSDEQLLTELCLQLADLFGQRGLADEQLRGRPSEVQLVGDRDEIAH